MNGTHRSRITAAIAVGLLAAALVGPLAAVAAPPKGWAISSDNLSTDGVSVGATAGFSVTINNTGPSNISSLYLLASQNTDGTALITDTPVYLKAVVKGGGEITCNPSGGVLCSFGAVGPNTEIDVVVAYTMKFGYGGSDIYFALNTTGVVNGGNNSHGDVIASKESVTILPAELTADVAGKWTTLANDFLANAAITATNLQQTQLHGLASYIGTYVQDGTSVSFSCPKQTCKTKPFGQWSKVSVAGGAPQVAPFQITITIAKSQLPSNLNLAGVIVYHTLDNGTTEVIGDIASERCGASGPATNAVGQGCIYPSLDGSGNLVINLWALRNGGFRGAG